MGEDAEDTCQVDDQGGCCRCADMPWLQSFLRNQDLDLAQDGAAADVTLRAGEEDGDTTDIRFVRFLLASQSPVFRRMLFGSMEESAPSAVVRVKFPAPVVMQMLKYTCTAQVCTDVDTVMDLHRLADFYQISELQHATASIVEENLNCETATRFLAIASRDRLPELKEKCMSFIQDHTIGSLEGDRVAALREGSLDMLVRSDYLCMSEIDIFRAVVRWGTARLGGARSAGALPELRERLAPLMENIRFPLMTCRELAEEVDESGLVSDRLLRGAFVAKFKESSKGLGKTYVPRNSIIIESSILDPSMLATLTAMFNYAHGKVFRLIHDMRRGADRASFDAAVRGVGPTLTLIREANTGYAFGAYVHDTYGAGRGWISGSQENFVFTLGNITGKPAKLVCSGSTAYWHDGCGLHIGDGDLVAFCSHSCTCKTFTSLAPGYSGVINRSLLSGVSDGMYTPAFMEVFALTQDD